MTPKEIEKLDKCMEHVRHETEKVMERETRAHDVLTKVSGKMMTLIASYKLQGRIPHHNDVEECAAMLCAIAIACTPDHGTHPEKEEAAHSEKEQAPTLSHSRFG